MLWSQWLNEGPSPGDVAAWGTRLDLESGPGPALGCEEAQP